MESLTFQLHLLDIEILQILRPLRSAAHEDKPLTAKTGLPIYKKLMNWSQQKESSETFSVLERKGKGRKLCLLSVWIYWDSQVGKFLRNSGLQAYGSGLCNPMGLQEWSGVFSYKKTRMRKLSICGACETKLLSWKKGWTASQKLTGDSWLLYVRA